MDGTARPVIIESIKIIETDDGAAVQYGEYIHTLNTSALEIFRLCDGNKTIDDIIHHLEQIYTNENLHEIVVSCIEQFTSSGLVKIS